MKRKKWMDMNVDIKTVLVVVSWGFQGVQKDPEAPHSPPNATPLCLGPRTRQPSASAADWTVAPQFACCPPVWLWQCNAQVVLCTIRCRQSRCSHWWPLHFKKLGLEVGFGVERDLELTTIPKRYRRNQSLGWG